MLVLGPQTDLIRSPVKDLNTYNSDQLEPSIIKTFEFKMRIIRYVVHLSKVYFGLMHHVL